MNDKLVKTSKIKSTTDKKILLLLENNGPMYYGEIIRSLKLSYKKGQEHLFRLKSKGYIRQKMTSPKMEINVDLK